VTGATGRWDILSDLDIVISINIIQFPFGLRRFVNLAPLRGRSLQATFKVSNSLSHFRVLSRQAINPVDERGNLGFELSRTGRHRRSFLGKAVGEDLNGLTNFVVRKSHVRESK
jgi:hypothetical protein